MSERPDLFRRLQEYAERTQLAIGGQLGFGVHGIVYKVQRQYQTGEWAIKVHEREADYCRERDVYLRLETLGVSEIRGCNVPELVDFDDKLLLIEMTVVPRPFILDFAGAYLGIQSRCG